MPCLNIQSWNSLDSACHTDVHVHLHWFFIPLDLDVHRTNYIFYDLKLDILLYMANLVTQKYLTDKKIMSLDYYIDRYED